MAQLKGLAKGPALTWFLFSWNVLLMCLPVPVVTFKIHQELSHTLQNHVRAWVFGTFHLNHIITVNRETSFTIIKLKGVGYLVTSFMKMKTISQHDFWDFLFEPSPIAITYHVESSFFSYAWALGICVERFSILCFFFLFLDAHPIFFRRFWYFAASNLSSRYQ